MHEREEDQGRPQHPRGESAATVHVPPAPCAPCPLQRDQRCSEGRQGEEQAERFALHLLRAPRTEVEGLVEALREAFDRMIKDPEFAAAAAQGQIEIRPLSGQELQQLVAETARTPEAIVKRAMDLVGGKH